MRRRLLALALAPAVLVAVGVLPWLSAWGRLPDPVATHWGLSGAPDGATPRLLAALLAILPAAGGWAALVAIARRRGAPAGTLAPVAGLVAFLAGIFAGTAPLVVAANLDAPTADAASRVGILVVLLLLAPALGCGALAARAARGLERPAGAPSAARLPSAGLAPGQRAAWVGTTTARWPLFAALVLALGACLPLAVGAGPALSLVLLVVAVPVAMLSQVEVGAGTAGVRVALGPFGWPVVRLPLGVIGRAEVIDVVPARVGGWGYRGSLRLFGRAAIVLRGGPGLEVTTTDGRVLVVAVDDPEGAAGVLNDLSGHAVAAG